MGYFDRYWCDGVSEYMNPDDSACEYFEDIDNSVLKNQIIDIIGIGIERERAELMADEIINLKNTQNENQNKF
jgi:hypothetical protein